MSLYGVQLIMNLAWSPIFFKQHDIGFALLDITALLGVLTATVVEFHRLAIWQAAAASPPDACVATLICYAPHCRVSPTAAYLMVPYLGWTAFATALTFDIYQRNPSVSLVLR